jgi:cation diffusion facilitator family transporter
VAIDYVALTPNEERSRRTAARISLVVAIILLVLKFWAFAETHSQAIFSDAVESIVNVVAAGLAMLVVAFSAKPADDDHPYGHGKIEYFSSAFEGGLIAFAAIWIIVEAIRRYLSPQILQSLDLGILVVVSTGTVNLILGYFLLRRGRAHGSIALRASGQHVISDFWTSIAVCLGLLFIRTSGADWADPLLSIAMGGVLAYSGSKLVRESVRGLMDEEDPSVLADLADVFTKEQSKGIIQIHHVKVIRSGWYHHIDAHIVLPEFWTVDQVHDRLDIFENKVIQKYPYGGEMNFHYDPCRRAYCRHCDLDDCPIRVAVFESRIPVLLEHMRSRVEPEEFRPSGPVKE